MKHLFKGFLSVVLLLTAGVAVAACSTGSCSTGSLTNTCTSSCGDCTGCDADDCNTCCDDQVFCKTFFLPRSQASNTGRRLVGSHLFTHKFDMDCMYGTAWITTAYQQSFRKKELAQYFLPACPSECIVIGANDKTGVQVRSADLGLSCTGKICPCPKVTSFIADLGLEVFFAEYCPGTYLQIYAPIVHTKVDWNCCPTLLENDSEDNTCAEFFAAQLMSQTNTEEKNKVGTQNLVDAFKGNFVWGDVNSNLNFARMCCSASKTRLADLQFNIGWDLWQTENYHFGLKAIIKAPTGNTSTACQLLEPIVGNGGHFEFGGGVSASAVLWDKDVDQQFTFKFEGDVTHLFKSRKSTRVFDLTENGCFSRYLLLKQFKENGAQLAGLERGPNVFNGEVKTSIGAQVDLTALFSYRWTCWNFDLYYNFWSRSKEKISDNSDVCCFIADRTYGIKGTTSMGDVAAQNTTTASKSTIAQSIGIATSGTADNTNDPIFVGCGDLDICSALAPSANSHTVGGNIEYLWEDSEWTPYFGVGGSAEFSGKGNRALHQWAIWAKGGITF